MSALPKLSDGLMTLHKIFDLGEDVLSDREEVRLDGTSVRNICRIITTLHAIAVDQEIELQCLRDMEAGRDIRKTAETLSLEQISNLLGDAEGNVIRPDFGGPKA